MSTDTTKLQQILPDLALSLGRSACEATGRDIRTVTIAVDAEMMDDPEASMAIDHGGWLLLVKCIDAAIRKERSRKP